MPAEAQDFSSMTDEEIMTLSKSFSESDIKPQETGVDFSSMSNDDLLAYATQLEQGQENRYTDLGEYYGDRIQSGITATPSMAGAAYKTLIEDPFTKGSVDSFSELYERFGENYMNYQHGYQEMFGMDVDQTGKKPPNDVHRYLGAGVEAFSDPYGLLVKTGAKITNVIGRVIGLQTIGMSAEAGGDIGGTIEEAVTGEPETGAYRSLGGLVGVLPGAVISRPVTSTLLSTGQSVYRKYKGIKNNPADVQQSMSTTYVKGILKKIVEENPDIDSILKDLNKIGVKWDAGNFPLIAAANQSPTAHAELVKLAKTNSSYRYGFELELKRMKDLVEQNADKIFGNRYAELPWSDAAIKKGLQARQQRLIKARSHIDDRIETLQDKLDPTMSDLDRGIAIEKLIAKRESLARAELKPIYDSLIEEATAKGVHVPAEIVGDFYGFIKENSVRDLFGKLTDVDKQVFKKLKPEIKTVNGIDIPEFKSMSFAQVESLKRAINRLKRSPMSKTEQRQLMEFENQFNVVRENLYTRGGEVGGVQTPGGSAGSFNERLLGVDKLYYEKVGLPFDAESIAQIGKKRYSSEVANIILKNREALDQYMNVAGKEGPQLARDAMIAKLHSKVVVDGILNPKKLARELAKNKDVIDGIPGMRAELDNLQGNADYLTMRVATLDDAVKAERSKVADHFLSTSGYAPDYKTLTQGMINNPSNLKKFLRDIKSLDSTTGKAVIEKVRREFVENLKTQSGGAYEFMMNPRNKKVLNDIMGKGYTKDLKDFAKVIDAMHGIDVKKLGATINKAELDVIGKAAPGLDTKYVSSQWRDRISSPIMKLTRLVSKMMDYKTSKGMDKSVYELPTDRDGMKKVNEMVAKMDYKIDTPIKLEKIIGLIKETLPVYMYTGVKTTVSHEAEEIEQKIQ